MRPSAIIDAAARLLVPSMLVVSVYFLAAGHNQPGGGFAGGLVAGAALLFRYVAGGVTAVRSSTPAAGWTIAGAGLAIAVVTASVPVLLGHAVLEHDDVSWVLPVLGTVKFTTALAFDIGVYLVVVGASLLVVEAFGRHRSES